MSEFYNEDLENCVSKDDDDDQTYENIFKNIFSSCDESKCGLVQVSKIIELVAPFLQHNEEKLQDLKILLDPQDNNPLITQNVFLKSMSEWTKKINDSPIPDQNGQNNIQCTSTPARKNYDPVDTHRDFLRFPDLNMSNISNYSSIGGMGVGYDPNILQEQINELEYQNKKLNEQLSEVRNQLIVSEEQNSTLQNDMEQLLKKLQSEQKTNEMYNVLKKEYEEYRENTESILKHFENANKKNMSLKKENSQLKQNIESLESENHKLVEQITQIRSRESLDRPRLEELQIELNIKDKEIETLESSNKELIDKLRDHEKEMQDYIDKIQHLKYENKLLEKRRNELLKVNSSMTSKDLSKNRESFGNISNSSYYSTHPGTPFSPSIENKNFQFFNYDSPYTRKNFKTSTETPPQKHPKNTQNSKIPIRKSAETEKYSRAVTSTPNKSDSDIVTTSPKNVFKCRSTECIFQKNQPIYHSLNIVPEVEKERHKSLPNDSVEIVVDKFEYHLEHVVNSEDLTRSSDDAEHFLETQMLTNIFVQTSPHESLMSELNHASTNPGQVCCDHGLQLIEKENRIKFLELKLSEHEMCASESENKKKEITKLQEKIKKVFNELDKVKTELKQSKMENMKISENNSKYEEMLHRTKSTMLELETRVSKYETNKSGKSEEIERLREKEQELKNEIKKLMNVIDELNKKYTMSKQETDDCKHQLRTAQKNQDQFLLKYKQLNKDIESLKDETKLLSGEKEKLEFECKKLRDQLNRKKSTDEEVMNKIKNYQFEIQEQEKRLKKMDNLVVVVADLEQNIDEYKRKYKDACRYQRDAIELKQKFDELGKHYEEKISNLLTEFNEEKDYFKIQIEELENIQKLLTNEKKSALSDINELNNKIKKLTTESEDLKIENQDLHNNIEELNDEIHRLLSDSTDIRKLETDILDLKNEIQKMSMESMELKTENHGLNMENNKLKNELNGINSEKSELKTEVHNLKAEINDYENELLNLNSENSQLNEGIEELKKENSEINDEINKIKKENEDLHGQIRGLRTKNEDLNNQFDNLKEENSKMHNISTELRNIQSTNYKLESEIIELKNVKHKLSLESTNLKTESYKLKTECSKLKTEIEQLVKDKRNILKDFDVLKNENQKLSNELESETKEKLNYKQQYQNIIDGKNEATKETTELKLEIEKFKIENQKLLNRNELLVKDLEKYSNDNDQLKNDYNELKNAYDRLQNDYDQLKHAYDQLKNDYDQLKNDYDQLRNDFNQLSTEKKKLQTELNIEITDKKNINNQLIKETEELKKEISKMKHQYESEITEKNNHTTELKNRMKSLIERSNEMESVIKSLRETENICDRCRELELDLSELRSNRDDDRKSARCERKHSGRLEILNFKLEKLDEQLFEEKEKNKSLSDQISGLKMEKSDLESELKKIKDEKNSVIVENEQLLIKIKKMTQEIEMLERKLINCRQVITDLNEKNATNNSSEIQLKETETKLKHIVDEYEYFKKHMCQVKNEIFKYRQNLGSQTLLTLNVWQSEILNILPNNMLFNALADNEIGSGDFIHPVDEEMKLFNKQIKLTTSLLNTMNKLKDVKRPGGLSDDLDSSVEELSYIRRPFTLRPPILILKSGQMSPDSVSETAMNVDGQTELNNNISKITLDMGNTKITSENKLNGSIKEVDEPGDKKEMIYLEPKSKNYQSSESGDGSGEDSEESSGSIINLDGNINEEMRRMSTGSALHDIEEEKRSPREVRSMSDGAASIKLNNYGDVMVFPNLQDDILENMGLLPDAPRIRMKEDEIEQKFQTLTLLFQTDAHTLVDRRERQMRQRDQAEQNMKKEMDRLVMAVHRLNPLCVDAEKTELVTSLLAQVEVLGQAADRISTAAELLGSVQQEWRLSESFNLMITHLKNLKQQRDTARRQLQISKKMLQESTETHSGRAGRQPIQNALISDHKYRRRASIAIGQPTDLKPIGISSPERRISRRTSAGSAGEVSPRTWESWSRLDPFQERLPITPRRSYNRLEIGIDLKKIREGTVEPVSHQFEEDENEQDYQTPSDGSTLSEVLENDTSSLTLKEKFKRKCQLWGKRFGHIWDTMVEEDILHELCCLGMIMCFAMATIIIGNLLIELEYGRRGVPVTKIPWQWTTWEELFAPFVRIEFPNGPPPV